MVSYNKHKSNKLFSDIKNVFIPRDDSEVKYITQNNISKNDNVTSELRATINELKAKHNLEISNLLADIDMLNKKLDEKDKLITTLQVNINKLNSVKTVDTVDNDLGNDNIDTLDTVEYEVNFNKAGSNVNTNMLHKLNKLKNIIGG